MLTKYSSRREKLDKSFLNNKLRGAKAYDRIAGYFSSSILEVASEELENMEGIVRVICNSDLNKEDVMTATLAKNAMRKEWCEFKPEEIPFTSSRRLEKLYNLLKNEKLQVRVLPNDYFGLIHGKAGVITLKDGSKTSFMGSVSKQKLPVFVTTSEAEQEFGSQQQEETQKKIKRRNKEGERQRGF